MNTEQLKYFMEFAFYGTAEKTAAQLGVSRYSVSRNIKKLEEELGSKLFTAGVQGIVLACHSQHSFLWVAPTTIPAASPEWFRPVPPGHHRVGCEALPSAVQ